MYKLSICIPTYNRAVYLAACLDSILSQISFLEKIEVVVSDNGSTDNTEKLIAKMIDKHNCLFYYNNKVNVGLDKNVLNCIDKARGEYVFLMGDDDVLIQGTLDVIFNYIINYDPDIIEIGHYSFRSENPLEKYKTYYPKYDKIFSDGEQFFNFCGLGFISGLIMKKRLVQDEITKVRIGKNSAHLDIASRVALKNNGYKIFVGTKQIAGRIPSNNVVGADLIENGYINVKNLWKQLVKEELLSQKNYVKKVNQLLYYEMPRHIIYNFSIGNIDYVLNYKDSIKSEFSDNKYYYLTVYPLFLVPRYLYLLPYSFLRSVIIYLRKTLYKFICL